MAPAILAHTRIECRRGDEHALFRRYQQDREPAVRDALIERFLPLARHLARKYPAGSDRDDLLQVASLALVNAVDRFDPDRGAAFTSFATPTILGEVKRYFRDHGWAVRAPRELQELAGRVDRVTEGLTGRLGRAPTPAELAERLDVSVERVLDALASASAHRPVPLDRRARDEAENAPRDWVAIEEHGFARIEDEILVDSLLDVLSPRERIVVALRFHEDLLQREVAELVGISQMQVSRTLASATAKLREAAGNEPKPLLLTVD